MSGRKRRKCVRKNLKRDASFHKKKNQRKVQKRRLNFTNVHHVVPKSRCQELGVNKDSPRNKVVVDKKAHDLYHQLFSNMTPYEAFNYLLRTFWNGALLPPTKFKE